MLPLQILLNNFLYDLAQVPIPSDRVDGTYMRKPKRWDIAFIRRYMLLTGLTPLPPLFFGFLLVMVVAYLGLMEVVKRWFYRRYPM